MVNARPGPSGEAEIVVGHGVTSANRREFFCTDLGDVDADTLKIAAAFTDVGLAELALIAGQSGDSAANLLVAAVARTSTHHTDAGALRLALVGVSPVVAPAHFVEDGITRIRDRRARAGLIRRATGAQSVFAELPVLAPKSEQTATGISFIGLARAAAKYAHARALRLAFVRIGSFVTSADFIDNRDAHIGNRDANSRLIRRPAGPQLVLAELPIVAHESGDSAANGVTVDGAGPLTTDTDTGAGRFACVPVRTSVATADRGVDQRAGLRTLGANSRPITIAAYTLVVLTVERLAAEQCGDATTWHAVAEQFASRNQRKRADDK